MDSNQFERLLYEEESTTLDFKVEQYRFAKADPNDKSELLKDLLGFANAWRRSDAFILVGVKDVRGGRAEVVGIADTEHLDDHSLQQFVNSLTNRPVRFNYEAFAFEGKQIGVIRIELQPRPIYLKKNYGKLKQHDVYVRRGSSTDPSKPADPVEISQMGNSSLPQSAEIERDATLGSQISCESEFCVMPPEDTIPDRKDPRGSLAVISSLSSGPNADFYREMAAYIHALRSLNETRLVIKNIGQVPATRVRLELTLPSTVDADILETDDMPDLPKSRYHLGQPLHLAGIQRAIRRTPGELTIDTNDERTRIVIDCGDLQPGRQVHSDPFFIGKRTSGSITLAGQVFADNLPAPNDISLVLSYNVKQTQMSLDQLIEFSRAKALEER